MPRVMGTPDLVVLNNDYLRATLLPGKGADIYSLVHNPTGTDFLFKTPWGLRPGSYWQGRSTSAERWLAAYPGGWQVLLPNGGDECHVGGTNWGFHGEAAMVPWQLTSASPTWAVLETRLASAPLALYRDVRLDGPVLRLQERVTNTSSKPVEFMWSHHPAFGPPFLSAACRVYMRCREVTGDTDSPGTVLAAGTTHNWPLGRDADGAVVDLSEVPGPAEVREVFAYLSGFEEPYYAITNHELGIGVGLRWPLDVFDQAWLWQEVHCTPGWPWFGEAYVMAIEPATTIPGHGLTRAQEAGHRGLTLAPGASREAVLEAVAYADRGPVRGIAPGGVVSFGADPDEGPPAPRPTPREMDK
jgi:Domain of unknown function (DUF4432)